MKAIPFDFKLKDYPTRLSPVFVFPNKKSELKITCIRSDQYKKFNDLMNLASGTHVRVENTQLYYSTLGNSELVFEDKCHAPYE